jgi:uncharacterized protein YkwD
VGVGLMALLLGALAAALISMSSLTPAPASEVGEPAALGYLDSERPILVPPAGSALGPGLRRGPGGTARSGPHPTTTTVPTTTPPTSTTTTATSEDPPSSSSTRETASAETSAAGAASEVDRVVQLVNAERAKAGCRALTVDQRLVNSAQAHSTDMAVNDYFSHVSLDGRTFDQRIRAAGYPDPGGENIAKGYRSADDVMRGWMGSSGHRANILNCGFTTIGVGLDTRGWYWTQNFGR